MKANEIKIELVKLDGVNALKGKGKLETDKKIITEKIGKLFRTIEHYKIDTTHIKRTKKGKAFILIDLSTHKSINPNTIPDANLKCQNCLGYLMQEKNWKAHQDKMKIPKWHDIKMMFAGFGVLFFILFLIQLFTGKGFGF